MSWKRPDTYGRDSRSVIDTAFDATATALAKGLVTVTAVVVPVAHDRAYRPKDGGPNGRLPVPGNIIVPPVRVLFNVPLADLHTVLPGSVN